MYNTRKIFSIKELNQYIKNLLDGDSLLSNIWLKGEITNFKHHSSGHLYFSLKDQWGLVKCVMFKSKGQRLKFTPNHGMEVLALGYVSVYERDGIYQLYVEDLLPAGQGALNLAYEELKAKLSAEGLFAPEIKKPIPFFPKKIGIVTSPTGAALKDVLSIIKRRNDQIEIVIVPAIVQGKEAIISLCKALDTIYKKDVDVIIIGRGGGSLEELWSFNEEEVVRKVSQSPIPIISAVGHETDITLVDFAADLRAATPSMAAELVAPLKDDLFEQIKGIKERMLFLFKSKINTERQRVEYISKTQILKNPYRITEDKSQYIDQLVNKLSVEIERILNKETNRVDYLTGLLDTLSPLKTLYRGYSVTIDENKKVITNSQKVEIGDKISVLLKKGQLSCLILGKEEDIKWKKD